MSTADGPETAPSKLSDFLVKSLPPTSYYIPNFLTQTEQSDLLSHINSLPSKTWTQLSRRRLQSHPSQLTSTGHLLTAAPLPSWLLDPVVTRMKERFPEIWRGAPHDGPNHVLVNEYLPGQGIVRH